MPTPQTVASLFEPEPKVWNGGTRGDPHLWRELRAHFANTPLPADAGQLAAQVAAAFATLTGHGIAEPQQFFVQRLAHGGLTSGTVSPRFWRETGIPLLLSRFAPTPPPGG